MRGMTLPRPGPVSPAAASRTCRASPSLRDATTPRGVGGKKRCQRQSSAVRGWVRRARGAGLPQRKRLWRHPVTIVQDCLAPCQAIVASFRRKPDPSAPWMPGQARHDAQTGLLDPYALALRSSTIRWNGALRNGRMRPARRRFDAQRPLSGHLLHPEVCRVQSVSPVCLLLSILFGAIIRSASSRACLCRIETEWIRAEFE